LHTYFLGALKLPETHGMVFVVSMDPRRKQENAKASGEFIYIFHT
jgi:hypothetical protein